MALSRVFENRPADAESPPLKRQQVHSARHDIPPQILRRHVSAAQVAGDRSQGFGLYERDLAAAVAPGLAVSGHTASLQ